MARSCPKSLWTITVFGTLCIVAATISQIVTLHPTWYQYSQTVIIRSWRNWIQMTVPWPWTNSTAKLSLGLWGACVHEHDDHCFGFHAEGQSIPWHLQTAVFLAMICLCIDVLLLALCFAELIYLWNRKEGFPLKKAELFMALTGALISIGISAVMGLLVISGYEQETWSLLRSRMVISGPEKLPSYGRFSVSQAWGFQLLSCTYFLCYMFIAKIQLTIANRVIRVELVHVTGPESDPTRRARIAVISPSFPNGIGSRTPPPAYSPPPLYAHASDSNAVHEEIDLAISAPVPGVQNDSLQQEETDHVRPVTPAAVDDTSSLTLLL